MNLLTKMLKMISYQENLEREGFILRETGEDRDKSGQNSRQEDKDGSSSGAGNEGTKEKGKAESGDGAKGKGRFRSGRSRQKIGENDSPRQHGGEGDKDSSDLPQGAAEGAQAVKTPRDSKAGGHGGRQKDREDGKRDKEDGNRDEKDGKWSDKSGPEKRDTDQPSSSRRVMKRPLRPAEAKKDEQRGRADSGHKLSAHEHIHSSLQLNREAIRELYHLPVNKDIVIRNFVLGTTPPVKAFAVFVDGMTSGVVQNLLFQALMLFTGGMPPKEQKLVEYVKENLLPGNQVSVHHTYREALDAINFGETAIFLEGCASAITVETKGWEKRGVERPVIEQIIRGPQEGFGETLRVNTAMIRKKLKNENLMTEMIKIGKRNRMDVAVMYLRDLANPGLVAEVKRRINSIKADYIAESGVLEQFIEDSPYNLSPQTLATERPDRVVAALVEGRVCIMVDGNPFALVVPTTMFELLHTGEENYLRWQYGTFIRYVRTLSFYLALLLPGAYLAVVLFHHEMIPTELLLAIAGNRERVPFPSVVEVLLMEFAFELIREGSLRLPGIVGSTIGIVGALILGQAAVQANIVSPILVILVGVTGLASFSIPNYSLSFALRIYRFMYILLGASMGFFGITLGLAIQVVLTANLKSFGVPYLTPAGPRTYQGTDVVTRLPVFFNEKRPDYINPRDAIRQPEISRGWVKDKEGGHNDRSG